MTCLQCNWDFKKYILSSYGFRKQQKYILQWAKEIWFKLQKTSSEKEYFKSHYYKLKSEFEEIKSELEELKSKINQLRINRYPKTSSNSSNYIDTSQLCELLTAKEWEKADKETFYLILELYKLQEVGYINKTDFYDYYWGNQASESLKKIDKLWVDYSDCKFGFSVQWSIYKTILENNISLKSQDELSPLKFDYVCFNQVAELIGWKDSFNYYGYEKIFRNFSIDKALAGQIPILRAGTSGYNRNIRIHAFWQLF
ncbi:MAG: hypothetical protein HC836_30065 [Richelia sp. RM2_1_2]|nr:hypothetical protein [Richelia sp. RM1_1_1]NJO62316.1 hypothetical protein [Richelia sp. RM2_1_2]